MNDTREAVRRAALPRVHTLSGWRALALSAAAVAASGAVAWQLEAWLSIDNVALVFLLGVTVAGALGGVIAAIVASLLSAGLYNFFFTEPRMTLLVAEPQDVTTLLIFLVISIAAGQLAGRLRERETAAQRATARVETLFDFSRRLATAVDEHDLRFAASRGFTELLGMPCVVLRPGAGNTVDVPDDLQRSGDFSDSDRAAAEWALSHAEAAGQGTQTLPAATWTFEPVRAGDRPLCVIALRPPVARGLSAEERRLLFSLKTQVGSAMERFRLQQLATEAHVNRETEALRAALLASVSHDLRTPLVSIIGSITALRDLPAQLSASDRTDLLDTALAEAERLNRFIQNLLDMTRLSYGALRPRLSDVSLPEVIGAAVRRLSSVLSERRVDLRLPNDLALVRADAVLLEQVIVNLLDNAAKYSPHDKPVCIEARQELDNVRFTVVDQGPGIAPHERERVFDLFYRARQRDTVTGGSGLGLSICKGFIEGMGGTIDFDPERSAGSTAVTVTLPVAEREITRETPS